MPTHDDCIVDAEPLARLLVAFIERWERDRPPSRSRFETREVGYIDPLAWLAAESGLPQKTIANIVHRDNKGRRVPRYSTTGLDVADAIVTAIGRPDALAPGGLLQVRGRHAKHDRVCCGGSTRLSTAY